MDESEKPELTLLQISDLHFGPPYREEAGEAVLRLANKSAIDAIIVSGDLTQRAKREQFEAARDFLSRLPSVPQLVIPGNHDVPLYRFFERMLTPHGLYQKIISSELNPVLKVGKAIIAGIDSTSPHTAISNGRIFRRQLETVAELFRNAPADAIRIVVAHHPFVPAPDCLRDKRVQRAVRAMKIFGELNIELNVKVASLPLTCQCPRFLLPTCVSGQTCIDRETLALYFHHFSWGHHGVNRDDHDATV